jgi:hypothetical protein
VSGSGIKPGRPVLASFTVVDDAGSMLPVLVVASVVTASIVAAAVSVVATASVVVDSSGCTGTQPVSNTEIQRRRMVAWSNKTMKRSRV